MSGKSPWSVKGISAEDREAAKRAARKAGVPIGVWLSEQIRQAAHEAVQDRGEVPPANGSAPALPEKIFRQEADRPSAHREMQPAHDRNPAAPPRFAFGRGQWSVAAEAVERGIVAQAATGYPWRSGKGKPDDGGHTPSLLSGMAAADYLPGGLSSSADPSSRDISRTGISGPDSAGGAAARGGEIGELKAQLQELISRFDMLEEESLARFGPVLRRIEYLMDEVESLKKQPADNRGDDAAPIEHDMIAQLAERVEHVEHMLKARPDAKRGILARLFRSG